jgi:hypothetical protein
MVPPGLCAVVGISSTSTTVQVHMGIDVIDPVQRDEVVLPILRIALGELDAAVALHVIDGADMATIGGTDFHMFTDIACSDHGNSPFQ